MVKKITNKFLNRLFTPVPKIIAKIQIISASVAGLDVIVISVKEKFPDLNIPPVVLNGIFWGGVINFLILQMTTHKDFEK